jgi:hypothetical protein
MPKVSKEKAVWKLSFAEDNRWKGRETKRDEADEEKLIRERRGSGGRVWE